MANRHSAQAPLDLSPELPNEEIDSISQQTQLQLSSHNQYTYELKVRLCRDPMTWCLQSFCSACQQVPLQVPLWPKRDGTFDTRFLLLSTSGVSHFHFTSICMIIIHFLHDSSLTLFIPCLPPLSGETVQWATTTDSAHKLMTSPQRKLLQDEKILKILPFWGRHRASVYVWFNSYLSRLYTGKNNKSISLNFFVTSWYLKSHPNCRPRHLPGWIDLYQGFFFMPENRVPWHRSPSINHPS